MALKGKRRTPPQLGETEDLRLLVDGLELIVQDEAISSIIVQTKAYMEKLSFEPILLRTFNAHSMHSSCGKERFERAPQHK
jgi:hypothetical protein